VVVVVAGFDAVAEVVVVVDGLLGAAWVGAEADMNLLKSLSFYKIRKSCRKVPFLSKLNQLRTVL
jgi:hypothetical protein